MFPSFPIHVADTFQPHHSAQPLAFRVHRGEVLLSCNPSNIKLLFGRCLWVLCWVPNLCCFADSGRRFRPRSLVSSLGGAHSGRETRTAAALSIRPTGSAEAAGRLAAGRPGTAIPGNIMAFTMTARNHL